MNITSVSGVRHRGKGWALIERKLVTEIRSEQAFSAGVVPLFTISETFSAQRTALALTCQTVLLPSLYGFCITA